MTGYTVHTGASKKFVSGWDRVFGDSAADDKKAGKSAKPKSATKAKKAGKRKK